MTQSKKPVEKRSEEQLVRGFVAATEGRWGRGRSVLLVGVSAIALFVANPDAYGRPLGGHTPSPSQAAVAAAQSGQQEAARAARQAANSLKRATLAIQAMQATQAAARNAARLQLNAMPSGTAHGLKPGGLQVAPGAVAGSDLWQGANLPTEFVEGDRTKVTVGQTQQKAILTWQTFNISEKTDLRFDQKGNRDWVALNRVLDNTAPSKILGNLKADGSVYIINRNGIIFGGTSQVNVGTLIASTANISNSQFLNNGIYSQQSGGSFVPSFTGAGGAVTVEAGAEIKTHMPSSLTTGGGFVALFGSSVTNAGSIATPKGQALLAAGDDFILRRGYGTETNAFSTTRGNEIATIIHAGSSSGTVANNGLIFSEQGDITLAGRTIAQNGILVSTSSVNTRGTIHLLNSANDTQGSVTLGANSLTNILPELESTETALNSQREALIAESAKQNAARAAASAGVFDNLSKLSDRLDQSRIEIVTGGNVVFKGGAADSGSLTIAQGGQVAVSAGGRIFTESGSTIDVSGVRDVVLAMAANNIMINIQGNELRDSPVNRDNNYLKNANVWIDLRDLIFVPSGTGGYQGDRYYTPGGLLEVGGYLANTAHKIGEWSAIGGTITLSAPEVIAQQGSIFDISGGSVRYESGNIRTTNFLGKDGRLYNINDARGDMVFYGTGQGYIRDHKRWGVTEVWTNPFGKGRESVRWEEGYTVGRDAGKLVLSTPASAFEGKILADTVTGERQTGARPSSVADGYKLGQNNVAQNGTLAVGQYAALGRIDLFNSNIRISSIADVTGNMNAGDALPADRGGTVWFDAGRLSDYGLGRLELGTRGVIAIDSDLTLANGGALDMTAAVIDIAADVTARGGSVTTTNVFSSSVVGNHELLIGGTSAVTLRQGATLDLRGVSTNALAASTRLGGLAYINGGSVSLQSTRDVILDQGSLIDVSSGIAILRNGSVQGGRGGNASFAANVNGVGTTGNLVVGGALRGYGVNGGGKLSVQTGRVTIGAPSESGTLALGANFFDKGFSSYSIIGNRGVSVADGAIIDVTMPVYRISAAGWSAADPAAGMELWTPPLYQENAATGVMTQRKGASLSLQSGNVSALSNTPEALANDIASMSLTIGKNAVIRVDAGQSINLSSVGQLTMNGALYAPGGKISVKTLDFPEGYHDIISTTPNSRSIWIGETARIDVAAIAATALDARGNRYGLVRNGGSIVIGGEIDGALGQATASANFVVVRPGAVLDASGTSAVIDILGKGPVDVASNGGSISLASGNGLYLDGMIVARAGGAGAAGGSLNLVLEMPEYVVPSENGGNVADPRVRALREMVLANSHGGSVLASDLQAGATDPALVYGYGRLGADVVARGGFDNLSVMSSAISFDGNVNLHLAQSLNLYSDTLMPTAGASQDARISLSAAYVHLGQINYGTTSANPKKSRTPITIAPFNRPDVRLDVAARLIDVRDNVSLKFGMTRLSSDGDLRFLQGARPLGGLFTSLINTGNITLRAAQVYPGTGAVAEVHAGRIGANTYDPAGVLRIEAISSEAPPIPLSAFGDLTLGAAIVEQAGVVRAPLGKLTLGVGGNGAANSDSIRVTLLPGSLTSVSGRGLLMPYGGTIDGLSYLYDGKEVRLTGVGGVGGTGYNIVLRMGVSLGGQSVIVDPGAVVDMSGGGDLTGAGFISGRGGSVNILRTPFSNANPANGFSSAGNAVYAIVPNFAGNYAPIAADDGAGNPLVGRQITLDGSVPGLPAGTYTLMPSTYALLPGAFRVEIGAQQTRYAMDGVNVVGNGSYFTTGYLGIANTAIRDSLASQIVLTPANVVRTNSQYNETSYADYVVADAVKRGVPRAMLPIDARSLVLDLNPGAGINAFRFNGTARFDAASGGYGGSVMVANQSVSNNFEIVGAGASASAGFDGVSIDSAMLNALGAARLVIGGLQYVEYGQGGSLVQSFDRTKHVYLRQGSLLAAPEVFVMANHDHWLTGNGIVVEQGARINTIGKGKAAYDSRDGYFYATEGNHLFVSNGVLDLVPSTAVVADRQDRGLWIGVCDSGDCVGETEIYSEGTVALVTPNQFQMDDAVRYGTRNLTLAVSRINIGDNAVLTDAAAHNILPSGLSMNQSVLNRLLRGDTQYGAPGLETLMLSASNAVNIFGTVTLDTVDPATGKSTLANLVLGTPAIYGAGGAGDVATIRTGNFTWRGSTQAPGEVVAGGAGTGSGTLNIEANRIVFGDGPNSRQTGNGSKDRLALGFANVNLSATDRISASQKGALSVYHSRGAYVAGKGYSYSGGNLTMTAPLMTGEGGSVNAITAGGALRLIGAGTAGVVPTDTLGAQLTLNGNSITLDSAIVLPSGKLALNAAHDITLTGASRIDMAGREIVFNDVKKYSWGGEVTLDSRSGNIRQAAGSVIDLSARYNNAGSLTAIALDAAAGVVDLQGAIIGTTNGHYDAGGTLVPYRAGSATIRAQNLGDFAALNARLNVGGVFGARSFQIKQGDLTIGNELKANEINVSLDNGLLTVNGTIDASGEQVGTIRLSAKRGLTLTGSAVLDAHGTVLRVDSYGKIIDSPNRAIVVLSSGDGRLTLAQGARIDLRHGTGAAIGSAAGQNDGRARGTLDLNAPRIGSTGKITDADAATYGDIDIDVSGMPAIQGARSIAVNAVRSYDDAPYAAEPAANGRPYQVIDQAWLDTKHADSTTFIDAALEHNTLTSGKLAGLNNATYRDAFHLRPAVEAVSKQPDGDLVVQGDLDMSGHRYASLNPNSQRTGVYGSGEAGTLTLRAGGDLNIYGSINDGFMPPPETQDDKGWLLLPGKDFTGGDIYVPRTGVVLADGTSFDGGKTLNYDLPIKAANFSAGTVIPVESVLNAPLELAAGTVLSANVRDASGNILFAAGSIVTATITLPAETRFDAGMTLPANASLAAMIWPKGIALPGQALYVLNGALTLPYGAFLPSGTDIKLPDGVTSVELRPGAAGKLWAVAKMLPEGSQSWSVRLVAGADTKAADNSLTDPHAQYGDLLLADRHYGMFGNPKAGGSLVWTQEGVDGWADPSNPDIYPGAPIDEAALGYIGMCADNPGWCQVKAVFTWTQAAADELTEAGIPGVVAGAVITDKFLDDLVPGLTVASFCTDSPSYCLNTATETFEPTPGSTRFSVVRTGASDLELLSARDLGMSSLFGVYTAGTSSAATSAGDPYNLPRVRNLQDTFLGDRDGAYEKFVDGGADSLARAWYPTGGGNLTIKAGGDLTGNIMALPVSVGGVRPNKNDIGYNSAAVGKWLWRQGTGSMLGGSQDQATAWSINFGSYVAPDILGLVRPDTVIGFTGFGTLGGGDLRVEVGGDAGLLTQRSVNEQNDQQNNRRTQGIVLAVGSTGRVGADGSLTLTGGGDLDLRVGGALNPAATDANSIYNGVVTNLRGNSRIDVGSVGVLQRFYGNSEREQSPRETRAYDLFKSSRAEAYGGLLLTPGDSVFTLASGGDLVVTGVSDPGRITMANKTPFTSGGQNGGGTSWFSLWTDRTAINLFSAGGDLVPLSQLNNVPATDSATMYPSILSAVAAGGSLYYGGAIADRSSPATAWVPLLLAPSANGKLEFLASDSIYAGGFMVGRSSASASSMATPFNPAFTGTVTATGAVLRNLSANGNRADGQFGIYPLFAFGPNTATSEGAGNGDPARFYAVNGDLVGVSSGRIVTFAFNDPQRAGQIWYQGAGPVRMMAGRDILGSGTVVGTVENLTGEASTYFASTGNLFVHNAETDVSLVQAGRDIIYSSFNVGGPGTLQISAGRNILMDDKATVMSIGPVASGDMRSGANILMQAGVGASGPNYAALLRYLDPANLLPAGTPLEGSGKVAKTYEKELAGWLKDRYGFAGTDADARAYFNALAPEQQHIFLRNVYFAELTAGGREYNDAGSSRHGSYLRGRRAIAALFPDMDADGKQILRTGDITMFGGSGVRTLFGGDIQMLTPGGKMVIGTEGEVPPSTSGLITQGSGNIALYSKGSILLGLSRIMTTFGGGILAWSADGDINAGRGAKTTVLYTPPRRVYDNYGMVQLSPNVPSSGAGIATLSPIPGIAAGNIDLIAPLGTIDAGEAGIRSTGNVNLAALQIVNAANVQAQGTTAGIPVVQAPNISGALAASNATAASQQTATPTQGSGNAQPSIIIVEVLGFGGGDDSPENARRKKDERANSGQQNYDPASKFQIIGNGELTDEEKSKLTKDERAQL